MMDWEEHSKAFVHFNLSSLQLQREGHTFLLQPAWALPTGQSYDLLQENARRIFLGLLTYFEDKSGRSG